MKMSEKLEQNKYKEGRKRGRKIREIKENGVGRREREGEQKKEREKKKERTEDWAIQSHVPQPELAVAQANLALYRSEVSWGSMAWFFSPSSGLPERGCISRILHRLDSDASG